MNEYKEPRPTTTATNHETSGSPEMTHEDDLDFEDFLASLNFDVEKRTPPMHAIERLRDSDLSTANKVNTLLTALGERPASAIVVSSEDWKTGEPEKALPDKTSEILELADSLGLHVRTRDRLDSSEELGLHWRSRLFSVSLSDRNAAILDNAFWPEDKVDELVLGKVLGFPDTAVAAYAAQAGMIPVTQLPYETLEDKVFTNFRMSVDNYTEELKTVRRWAHAVKEADIMFYNSAMLSKRL